MGRVKSLDGLRQGLETGPRRILATLLFTDLVQSTERAVELGDRQWLELLEAHHAVAREQLSSFQGRLVEVVGDGLLAAFDLATSAVRCASALRDAVHALGLEIRAGLHTGECELFDGRLRGVAVHTGARVSALAEPGEVLVSRTVYDVVSGSGLRFSDRGDHELRGIPGAWRLYALAPDDLRWPRRAGRGRMAVGVVHTSRRAGNGRAPARRVASASADG
ncbi:MAG TPA: adenylate/guanylate cyclase domain-containing protein [Actinomycetota bacterium]